MEYEIQDERYREGYGDILTGDKKEKTDGEIAAINDVDLKKAERNQEICKRRVYGTSHVDTRHQVIQHYEST